MIDQTNINRLRDAVVYAQGDRVGSVDQVFLDDDSNVPTWVTVSTGLFGMKTSFVPIDDATFDGERLEVSTTKDVIKDAPRIDADQHLSPDEERELYRYYQRSTRYDELERRGYDVDADRMRERDADRIHDRAERRDDLRDGGRDHGDLLDVDHDGDRGLPGDRGDVRDVRTDRDPAGVAPLERERYAEREEYERHGTTSRTDDDLARDDRLRGDATRRPFLRAYVIEERDRDVR